MEEAGVPNTQPALGDEVARPGNNGGAREPSCQKIFELTENFY